jgi:hypothetical protein
MNTSITENNDFQIDIVTLNDIRNSKIYDKPLYVKYHHGNKELVVYTVMHSEGIHISLSSEPDYIGFLKDMIVNNSFSTFK